MATENYPVPGFHFQVEWQGSRVGFTEVSGLSEEVKSIEYREGSSPDMFSIKMTGQRSFTNVTMKRGMFRGDNELALWLTNVSLNKPERRTIQVKLLDETHNPIFTWTLFNCFPTKVSQPTLNSTGNEVAVESIDIVYESFKLEATA